MVNARERSNRRTHRCSTNHRSALGFPIPKRPAATRRVTLAASILPSSMRAAVLFEVHGRSVGHAPSSHAGNPCVCASCSARDQPRTAFRVPRHIARDFEVRTRSSTAEASLRSNLPKSTSAPRPYGDPSPRVRPRLRARVRLTPRCSGLATLAAELVSLGGTGNSLASERCVF